jgi:predicted  nucleic acid-binding Zn-ribbon protein
MTISSDLARLGLTLTPLGSAVEEMLAERDALKERLKAAEAGCETWRLLASRLEGEAELARGQAEDLRVAWLDAASFDAAAEVLDELKERLAAAERELSIAMAANEHMFAAGQADGAAAERAAIVGWTRASSYKLGGIADLIESGAHLAADAEGT